MKWLTVKQAMQYMNTSRPTLLKRIYEGDIYAKKDGGKWKIDKTSIDRYMDSDRLVLQSAFK